MKIKAFVLLYAGLLLAAISLVQVQNTLPKGDVLTEGVAGATKQRIVETYGKLPLSFEANQGQTDRRVKFISRGPGYTLFLNSTEAVLSLSSPQSSQRAQRMTPNFLSASSAPSAVNDPNPQSTVLRMKLVGANPHPEVVGLEELPGKSNYFIGNDPAKWRTNVPTYARVQYKDVYPGVDLVYYGNQRQLEYDLIVAPGADPGAITLSFEGVERLRIDAQGDLVLDTSGGEIRQHKPLVYQEVDGVQREISGAYVLNGGRQVGFEVAAYDASKPLIIDPVLSYSTYLGGSRSDAGFGIAVDASGNAYVTGFTGSTDFPTASPLQPAFGGGPSFGDAFVTKVSASGNALVYSTYLGGSDDEFGEHIAVDASGNAYVTGLTDSTNFPTASPFQAAFGGNRDAFVTKLNAAGNTLVYSTYLGGENQEVGFRIAVDISGNAYVVGATRSTDFPTASPFQPANAGNFDTFVTKLNAAGNVLVYSTYLGGSALDSGDGIAVDTSGNAYVTGCTQSTDFPTVSPFQAAFDGARDIFVTKLNAAGNALVYSTYLGGSGNDESFGIAVDASGNAYVTGVTGSTDFPTASPIQSAFGGGTLDAFVTKLNAAGSGLVYSTYLGGSADDDSRGIAVDAAGNAYLAGFTGSPNFPTASPIQPANAGGTDAFVTKLNAAGNALVYSTYLGGTESGRGIAVDASGNAYVTGQTNSTNFPTVNPFQATKAGSSDAFVAKITVALPDIIPQIANSGTPESGGFFMIFNAVNVTSEPATVTVEFFDSQGAPMSMPILGGEFVGFTATLQPGGYTAVQTVPNGSGARIGYALITSTPNDSVAVNATFVQLVPGRPPFMAGIPATNTLHSTAYMPYVSDGGFTPSLALVSQLAQTVTLTARSGVEGAFRCSTTLSFVDGEHRAFLLRDVLPCTATGEGSLEILGSSSTPELSGIGFLANDEGAFVTQPIWSSTGAGGIVPQIANTGTPESGGFFTIFSAVNVTSEPATVTVEFFDSQGAPMSMPILGGEFVGFTATLQPGGYTAVQTVPNGSGARIGYALITSTPNDSVAVNATFVQLVPGRPPFMAGIPATNTLHSTAYMPYVSDGGFTPSLALVSQLAQTVTLTARSGVEGAFRCSTTLSFVDGEHRAFLLRDVLPCTATGKGSLEILGSSSTPELSGIGFLANDEGAFVTQPIWSR